MCRCSRVFADDASNRWQINHTRVNKAKWTHLEVDICSQMAITGAFSAVEERMKHAGLIINPAAAQFREGFCGRKLKRIYALCTFLFPFNPLEAVYDEVINRINFKG